MIYRSLSEILTFWKNCFGRLFQKALNSTLASNTLNSRTAARTCNKKATYILNNYIFTQIQNSAVNSTKIY